MTPGEETALDATRLEDLAQGALVLAAGAEHSSYRASRDWARASIAEHGPVPLIRPGDLGSERMCVTVSLLGSSAALAEQLPTGEEPRRAVRALERRLGRTADAVVPLNTAAENALLAVVTAASCGLPLVDGDGCGRVLPLLEQTTFTIAGVDVAPVALATPAGDVVVVEAAGSRVEELVRPLVLAAGGWAVAACYAMDGARLAAAVVPGTVSRALAAGRPSHGDPFALWQPKPRRLGIGRITAVEHPATPGPDTVGGTALPSRPTSVVVSETEGLHRRFRLEAHNEVLLVLADGAPAAAAPDQILMLSAADQRVLDVERAIPGVEVEIVVIPAAPAWHSPQGRRLAAAGGLILLSPDLEPDARRVKHPDAERPEEPRW
ncbi:DUF917 domain-containing protein [Streptomyces sp. WAC01280]|uniref:DUF917 domain-containing protein n=1 Tax=Streptomyces sp. WAC01280 TaxID=2487424 RepID=UPI000F77ADAA|nr:DUF917 domain-containing protein [Streptomyces sp. WAC01280]RSS58607.1 DUF917 domain-containing protein [Streptomyces sp. WAC01280]